LKHGIFPASQKGSKPWALPRPRLGLLGSLARPDLPRVFGELVEANVDSNWLKHVETVGLKPLEIG